MTIKSFAQVSRRLLMDGVYQKLLFWGFDEQGAVVSEPDKIQGGFVLRGEAYDDPTAPVLWQALKKAIAAKGLEVVVEEAAYTWFNRIMAIKILSKNGFEEGLLDPVDGMPNTPKMIQKARQGARSYLNEVEEGRVQRIVNDFSKDQELFTLLLTGYCHSNKTLSNIFGRLDDYTELLLPDNMLQEGGFLHLLNTSEAISDEEYKKVELIGWLYQFYISERKDEVFAAIKKNKKAEAKDIPAATQIFTPNWIVKYMVENTAGKIWLDKYPDSSLKTEMKYLVTNEQDGQGKSIISDVEELTLIDPACGSGHILVEGFDLLYKMYQEEFYSPEEAVEKILTKNLFGLDLDDRAAQLATFAILLKASKVYRDVWSKGWKPHVYAMPESKTFQRIELQDFLGEKGFNYLDQLEDALRLMKQSKNLGSIMKLKLSDEARTFIEQRFTQLQSSGFKEMNEELVLDKIKTFIPVLLLLTKKYASVVANPPYMGQKSMNGELKQYVNAQYPLTKSDLFAVFMDQMIEMLCSKGRVGCITMESWMFLTSYEKFRVKLIDNYTISGLAHFGWHIIGIAFGTATLILEKAKASNLGEYSYLTIDDIDRDENVPFEFPKKDNGRFAIIPQTNFSKIPGSPIAYWVSQHIVELFNNVPPIESLVKPKQGTSTGDNTIFLRLWTEINKDSFNLTALSSYDTESIKKWYPATKGGTFRRWYGNNNHVVNWRKNGHDIRRHRGSAVRNLEANFLESLTWSGISSYKLGVRFCPSGYVFTISGKPISGTAEDLKYTLAFLCTKIPDIFLEAMTPTMSYEVGYIKRIPLINSNEVKQQISVLTELCIYQSKNDWDSRESSWEFHKSPLLNPGLSFSDSYLRWQREVTDDFFQLHENEEELNRIFIDIYGLQEELTPDVLLKDITILQEELDRKELEELEPVFRAEGKDAMELPIDRKEVISQFISYAVGVFMGRYRLDKPGLNIAHPDPSPQELSSYYYNGQRIEIDEDAILPLMGSLGRFNDDLMNQFKILLDAIWGPETRTENMNFIQECLGKELEKFLVKEFYKYHCKKYKKKPIYWLFASKKGAFQVLVYMHRMNAFTVEKIRSNYLLEHLKYLRSEIISLEARESSLSSQESKLLQRMRKDLIECEEYDLELKDVADKQISFDLDDGVTVNHALFGSVLAKIK